MKTINLFVAMMLVAGLALLGGPVPVAQADTITVDTTADDNTTNGNCTLREAIIAANTDTSVDNCPAGSGADTIILSVGTYTLTIPGSDEDTAATGDLDINDDLTITGEGQATTIIDGGALDRVFHILSGSTVEISEVTVRNGWAYGRGGGLWNEDGTLLLNNSTVSGCWTNWGAIYNNDGGIVTLNNSTVSGNTGSYNGGGFYNAGTMTLNNSIVSGNTASVGGGIYGSFMTLNNSTVSGNTANNGGGICSNFVTLNNSTVSGNTASPDGAGGGIYSEGTVTLNNSTVSGNTAGGGGGIYNNPISTVILKNTIVADNPSGGDCSGLITSLGHNLDSDGTCNLTATGDIPNTNPLLGLLQDNGGPTETHALLSGSPAIDHIPPGACPVPTDQRGVARPQPAGGNCDIGAYELEQEPTIMVPIDIKPGSDPNSINCNNENGVITVAILTTDDFDATTVDHTTVTFEGASEIHVDKKSGEPHRHEEDVDGDGDTDLVFHFRLGDTGLTCESTEGTLIGETFEGQAIEGTDAVRMID